MKKKLIFALSAIFLCGIFSGCEKERSKDFQIVTSCYPVYVIASNIVWDVPGVQLLNMCSADTGCLHNFKLQSDDLKKIEKSSAFIINGAGMEPFTDKITSELPNINIIDSSVGIELLNAECEEEHEHAHEHGEYNPHIWMSVGNCIKQVENITDGLKKSDPEHADIYEKNSKIYIKKLEDLKSEIYSKLSGVKNRDIITFHEAFPYFAKEFNLNIAGVINHEPEDEPSVKEITETVNLIKEKNIKCLFAEPQYSQNAALTISQETGAKIYTLDPIVTGEYDKDSYLKAMKENLKVLVSALK